MYFRLVVESGHVGAGKSVDTVRYHRAESAVDVFGWAARSPRAKRKSIAGGVKSIQPITREEYERGLRESKRAARDWRTC